MTIKDADGNEHELRVGQLVQATKYDSVRLWRVSTIGDRAAACFDYVSEGSTAKFFADLLWVSDEPLDEEKEPTLLQRRERLLNNLDRAYRQSSYDDRATLQLLTSAIYKEDGDNVWFWRSVTESLDDPRQVSYAPTKEAYDINAKRKRCRISKFLKTVAKRFGLEVTDAQADRIGELFGAHFPSSYDYTFEVVRGNGAVYDGYADRANESWGSCMHICDGRAKPYVRWYDENPDRVGLVKIMQGDTYCGRALIWNTDEGTVVVDRVYPSDNGPHTTALHAWADANGYDYKTRQACVDNYLKSGRTDYAVTVKASSSGDYPYCDTFKYTDDDPSDDETLTLTTNGGEYTFNETCGGYDGGGSRYTCEACGDRVDEDECETCPNGYSYCSHCYNDRFTYLEYQRPNGSWVERTVDNDDAARCENCDDMRLRSHLEEVRVHGSHEDWCEQCREDDACHCANCEEYHHADLSFEYEGDQYCPDCVDADGVPTSVEVEPVATAAVQPAVTASPAAPAPLSYDDSYPLNSGFGALCAVDCYPCHNCIAIRARREREFDNRHPWSMPRPCYPGCTACAIHFQARDQLVNAPYPNEQEAEVLRQLDAARTGLSTPAPNASEAGTLTLEALEAFRNQLLSVTR